MVKLSFVGLEQGAVDSLVAVHGAVGGVGEAEAEDGGAEVEELHGGVGVGVERCVGGIV